MIAIPLEIHGDPKNREEWERATRQARDQALEEMRASGMPPELLAEAAKEMDEMVAQLRSVEDLGQFSIRQAVTLTKAAAEMVEKLPRIAMALGRGFAQQGEHAHNFQMGVVQSEINMAVACLEHAAKVLSHVGACERKTDKQVKPQS